MLVELTHNVGIAAAIPELAQELDQIQLVPLSDRRVLMVLVTRDHMVRNRVVMLDEPASPEELGSICNYVNRNFSGWQLGQARRELLRRIDRGARAVSRRACASCRCCIRRGCWRWTRRRRSTWKAPATCWGWTCT